MSEQQDPMCAWRIRALGIKKATYRGAADSAASEKTEVGAGCDLGAEEA